MKILIVTGGRLDLPSANLLLKKYTFDRVIAADAGLASCQKLDILPTDILGDFDSLTNLELREYYRDKGIDVREFPTRKDYTDSHLAVLYAMDLWKECGHGRGEEGIWILGATGTRFDHTLANVGLLVGLCDREIPCKIIDENNEIEMLKGPVKKSYKPRKEYPYISLLPFSKSVTGVNLEGFSYPLEDAELKAFESMGISNEIVADEGIITIKDGYMLVVRARD